MKNKFYNSIVTYFTITLLLALVCHYFIVKYTFTENSSFYYLLLTLLLVIVSPIVFTYIIKLDDKINNYNIEKLKKINDELFKSNEKYDIVAKATSDTIWDWDIKTGRFVWNKGIQGIFGYKKEDVGNNLQWWFEKIHPEDSLKISVKLYSFIEQKTEKWQDHYRFMCADGSYKYVFDRGFLVMDEQRNVIRMIGAVQDITKQKIEEERLKLLETVITQTKDSVIITESENVENESPKIIFANPAFKKMTGYATDEIIDKSPLDFLNKFSARKDIRRLIEAFKKKEGFTFETLNKRKNNEQYWTSITMLPITNKDNQHSHWISIQRDITIEKEREQEREHLIKELTQNNKDLKQFSYITSHNLRAPLSNLSGLLNLIEDIPIENYELKEIIKGFSKSTTQLNDTINDLANVIIIKDSPSIEKQDVVIKDVFENVFNQLSFLISLKKPIIKLNLEDTQTINLNRSYIESILLNLITNSLRYSDPKKQLKIFIASKKTNDETILTFKDNGLGIDLERNKDKIFGLYQRFHDHPDSKGLGLYLVKSQVESMGGTIGVKSQVGIGTTFTIIFKNNY